MSLLTNFSFRLFLVVSLFFFFFKHTHTVQRIKEENSKTLIKCEKELTKYLTEGVLTEDYVLDHIPPLMNCLRRCNVTLRSVLFLLDPLSTTVHQC